MANTQNQAASEPEPIFRSIVLAVLVVFALELMNRHFFGLLYLNSELKDGGTIWSGVVASLALIRFLRDRGYVAAAASVVGFCLYWVMRNFLVSGELPNVNRLWLEPFLSLFYGLTIGPLGWPLASLFTKLLMNLTAPQSPLPAWLIALIAALVAMAIFSIAYWFLPIGAPTFVLILGTVVFVIVFSHAYLWRRCILFSLTLLATVVATPKFSLYLQLDSKTFAHLVADNLSNEAYVAAIVAITLLVIIFVFAEMIERIAALGRRWR